MADRMRFHFDPACPWCYQTSRWARRLAELGEIELEWGLFSLALANAEGGDLDADARAEKRHGRSGPGLRAGVLVRDEHGSDGLGAFYAALGRRVHEQGEPLEAAATVEGALVDAGFDPALAGKALADDGTWARVEAEHRALVETTRAFGVPTIVLLDGEGQMEGSIFGPVISQVPDDADAVELYRHVAWLVRYDNFSELKRERIVERDLPRFPRRG